MPEQLVQLTPSETQIFKPSVDVMDALVRGYTQGMNDAKQALLATILKNRAPEESPKE